MELFLFFILWIIFGAVSWTIAGKKGRSGCGWGLLGFLLGPVGLLVALLPPIEGDETKKCPQCAEIVKAEAKICRFCRYEFKNTDAEVTDINTKKE